MSSRLQLDVRNLSQEIKADIGVLVGNTVIHAWVPWEWGTT